MFSVMICVCVCIAWFSLAAMCANLLVAPFRCGAANQEITPQLNPMLTFLLIQMMDHSDKFISSFRGDILL